MKTVVLVPCHNEAATIGRVVDEFREELPEATIQVYDNRSTDDTAAIAREHGAVVHESPCLGKGAVIRHMFEAVDADVYVMVDGDGTYDASIVRDLIGPVERGEADMVMGNRLVDFSPGSFPPVHLFGNRLVSWLASRLYGERIDDMLTGYRAMHRRVVRDLNLVSRGFEIETEINVKCLHLGFRVVSVPTRYSSRPEGSLSKIRTFSDGYRILFTLFMLLREYQPVTMAGLCFLLTTVLGLGLFVWGWWAGNVLWVLAGSAVWLAGLVVLCTGVVLHGINMANREAEAGRRKLLRAIEARKTTDGAA